VVPDFGGRGEPAGTPTTFAQRVYHLVHQVPHGKVVSYGGVAAMLDHPRAARAVGWALRNLADNDEAIPWWRVINRNGEISIKGAFPGPRLQRELLEREGVEFDAKGRVDWRIFGWRGAEEESPRRGMGEMQRAGSAPTLPTERL
jgi:methylated-DNA-protein-cysteine methyltransferase-like protein